MLKRRWTGKGVLFYAPSHFCATVCRIKLDQMDASDKRGQCEWMGEVD